LVANVKVNVMRQSLVEWLCEQFIILQKRDNPLSVQKESLNEHDKKWHFLLFKTLSTCNNTATKNSKQNTKPKMSRKQNGSFTLKPNMVEIHWP